MKKTLNIIFVIISLPFLMLGFISGIIVNGIINGFYYSALFFQFIGWETK